MSEHTPITGELREAVEWEPTFCGPDRAMVPQPEFDSLCDAIDAVHAGLERENAELRQRVAELDESADSMHDSWVRLPLDADGAPIRVGDEVVDELDEPTLPSKVTSLYLANDGWWVYIGVVGRRPSMFRHHNAPTVEDVLTKFGIDWEYEDNCEDRAALLAEYAKRLRLSGDAE